MKYQNEKLILSICVSIFPFISKAGGLKGNLFSDEELHIFAFILVLIYLSSLAFSLIRNLLGVKWCGVVGAILTSLLFFPAVALAMIFPEVGLPIAILTGVNYILIWKKPKRVE